MPLGEGDLSISQFLVPVAARGVLVSGAFEERKDAGNAESAFMGKHASDLNSAQVEEFKFRKHAFLLDNFGSGTAKAMESLRSTAQSNQRNAF